MNIETRVALALAHVNSAINHAYNAESRGVARMLEIYANDLQADSSPKGRREFVSGILCELNVREAQRIEEHCTAGSFRGALLQAIDTFVI